MDKLEECPNCHTAKYVSVFPVDDDTGRNRYDAECNNCGLRVEVAGFSHEEAVEAWNRMDRKEEGGAE